MQVHQITTESGSTYRVEERPDGRYFITAEEAKGKGARLGGALFEITRPMPWPVELGIPLWVRAATVEQDFPFYTGHMRTSPVRSYASTQVDETEASHA